MRSSMTKYKKFSPKVNKSLSVITALIILGMLFQNCKQTSFEITSTELASTPPQKSDSPPITPPEVPVPILPPIPQGPLSPHPAFMNLKDNEAINLGLLTCTATPGEIIWEGVRKSEYPNLCRTLTDYSRFIYDPRHHQMLMFGGGHSATMTSAVHSLDLNPSSNLKWKALYEPTQCSDMHPDNFDAATSSWRTTGHPVARHTYDLIVMTQRTQEMVLLGSGSEASGYCANFRMSGIGSNRFDPRTLHWNNLPFEKPWRGAGSSELDPLTDNILVLSAEGLFVYDYKENRLIDSIDFPSGQISTDLRTYYAKNLLYFPPNDKFYFIIDGDIIYEISLNRSDYKSSLIRKIPVPGGSVPDLMFESGFAYDSHNKLIGGGILNNQFYAYNPISNMWSSSDIQIGNSPGNTGRLIFHAIDFDPISNTYIFINDQKYVFAYRFKN